MHKFLRFEGRDPFQEKQKREDAFNSDWDRFAFAEYHRLASEEEGYETTNDNGITMDIDENMINEVVLGNNYKSSSVYDDDNSNTNNTTNNTTSRTNNNTSSNNYSSSSKSNNYDWYLDDEEEKQTDAKKTTKSTNKGRK